MNFWVGGGLDQESIPRHQNMSHHKVLNEALLATSAFLNSHI
jgi:hypothetical protein